MSEYSKFEDVLAKQGTLFYSNTGDSMLPLLRQHRDVMIIKPKPEGRLHRLDIALYKRDDGTYIIHRVLKVREHDYIICGDNCNWTEIVPERQIIGVLDSLVRNGKTIPLRSTPEHPHVPLRYKIYEHLWCDIFSIRPYLLYLQHKWRRLTQ